LRSAGSATPISKAFEVTQQLVQNEVKEDHPGIRQSPVLHSKWSGNELILAVKPSAPERVPATVVSDLDPDSTVATAAMAKAVSSAPPRGVTRAGLRSEGKLVLTREYFSNEPDPKAALKAAYEAKAAHFNDVQAYLAIAKVQIQLGKFSSAMQQLKDVLTDDPNIVEAYLARAYCFHKMGLEGNAKADLKMAIEKGVTLPKDIEFGD
ncbi:MAG TPA: tetratricopeptide repeat protein, partial [Candidatus Obscuribacterales bacterium]